MRRWLSFWCILCCHLSGGLARAAEDPSTPAQASAAEPPAAPWVALPVAMYSPETHFGLGGVAAYFFDLDESPEPDDRASSLALIGLLTTRSQVIAELHPDLYLDHGNFRFWNKLEFQRYPNSFWGIGARTPDSAEERYLRQRFRWRADPRRRIVGALFAGVRMDLMYLHISDITGTGAFAAGEVPGASGGFNLGVGPLLTFDTRDLTTATRRGTLLEAAWIPFPEAFGNATGFSKLVLDARQFIPVLTDHTLALRAYIELQEGQTPFYHLALLGGDDVLRGYFLGRYRDKHVYVVNAEYRLPLFWRLGAVAFAGAGEVAHRLRELDLDPVRWAVGAGLRFALSEAQRLNLRMDVGVGPDTFGVYLTAGEVF